MPAAETRTNHLMNDGTHHQTEDRYEFVSLGNRRLAAKDADSVVWECMLHRICRRMENSGYWQIQVYLTDRAEQMISSLKAA